MSHSSMPGSPVMADDEICELLLLVGDESKGHKMDAMNRLLSGGVDTCYYQLEKAVRNDHDADVRNGAMEVLVRFGALVVPRLIVLLDDANEEVRNFSTVMLGDIGSAEAVLPLIRALDDSDANVRHGAAEALGKIGDKTAVQALRKLQQGDFWDRCYADAALHLLDTPIRFSVA